MFASFIVEILKKAIETINSASFWIITSLIIILLLKLMIKPKTISKWLGNYELDSIIIGIVSGIIIPTLGSGSLVLGIGMFQSGASTGASLSFITSSILLNPFAIFLSLKLFGKDMTRLNVILALFLSFIIGLVGNFFLQTKNFDSIEKKGLNYIIRFKKEMSWLNSKFAPKISFLFITGIIINSLINLILPIEAFYDYLINPKSLTIPVTAFSSIFRYIDPVAYIVYAVSLISSGAKPGIAMPLILVGFASNISTILCIGSMINKRSAILITTLFSIYGIISGIWTNYYFGNNFYLSFNYEESVHKIVETTRILESFPNILKYISSLLLILYAFKYLYSFLYKKAKSN